MNKTATINLSGQVFTIDDDAYKVLESYLNTLRTQLGDDDDREEILHDFEQAIAEHLLESLKVRGKVVTLAMVKRVTETIGVYEPTEESAKVSDEPRSGGWQQHFRRTLYLNKDDAIIAGVCGGIARALDVDSFWIRVLFVILAFATSGFMIVVYIILSFIMLDPESSTKGFTSGGKALSAGALVARSKQGFNRAQTNIRHAKIERRFSPLARFVKKLFRFVAATASIILITLITIGYVIAGVSWLAHRSSTNQPFSASPGGVNYALLFGSYLVLVLPLLAILLVSLAQRLVRTAIVVRIGALLLGTWLIALVLFVGAAAVAIPDWANWSRQHPHNGYFQLQVNKGHVDNICLNVAGHCNDHPQEQPKYIPSTNGLPPQPPKPQMMY